MSAEDLEFRVLPIIKTNSDVTDGDGDSSGCQTPKSPRHMIPPVVSCPPAPKKQTLRRPAITCKRRLRRVALFKINMDRDEIECFFRVAEKGFVNGGGGGGVSKRSTCI